MKRFHLNGRPVCMEVPAEGFDLRTASRPIRKAAAMAGIKSGRWAPINAGIPVDHLGDTEVVARVWDAHRCVNIDAGEVRFALGQD